MNVLYNLVTKDRCLSLAETVIIGTLDGHYLGIIILTEHMEHLFSSHKAIQRDLFESLLQATNCDEDICG